jgi:hypothetical protein
MSYGQRWDLRMIQQEECWGPYLLSKHPREAESQVFGSGVRSNRHSTAEGVKKPRGTPLRT